MNVSKNHVEAVRKNLTEDDIMTVVRGIVAAASNPGVVIESLRVSSLCITDQSTNSAVLVAFNATTWDLVKKRLGENGAMFFG